MKLSLKLSLLFSSMALVPVLIVGYLSYQNGRKTIYNNIVNHLLTANDHKSSELRRWIDANANILEVISRTRFFNHDYADMVVAHNYTVVDDPAQRREIVRRYIQPFIHSNSFLELFIMRAGDGKVLLSTDSYQEDKFYETRPYFIHGLKGTFIQNVYYSMSMQAPAMTISTPVKDTGGDTIAVLAGRVDLSVLTKIFQTHSKLYRTEDSYLVNTFNFFITEPRFGHDYALKKTIHSEAVAKALKKESGISFYENYRKEIVIGAYQWLPRRQLCLITEIDESEAFARIYTLQKIVAGVGLGIGANAALLGWIMAQTLTRPLQRLLNGTIEVGKGKLEHSVATSSKDEIGDLSRAFDSMQVKLKQSLVSRDLLSAEIEARKRTETSLRKSQNRLRRAEAIGHLGNWRLNLETDDLSWSDEVYRIYAVAPETFTPCFDEWLQMVHSEDYDGLKGIKQQISATGKNELECRFFLHDGTLRHTAIYGEIERDASGRAVSIFGTILDITESKMRRQELEEKNAELERFTYMISHDLKSPIITVKTFAGYLREDLAQQNSERVEKDIFYIQTAADKMNRLLDELLEMSRIGRLVNPPVQCDWRELVTEALDNVAGPISEKKVAVEVEDRIASIYGDAPRIVEIWQNLVENAVKYMGDQPHPRIDIGMVLKGNETTFFVRDNGMGIDPRYQGKVFGWFEKLDSNTPGTGLGLALVKRIVGLYGGRIWLESNGLGQGSCFYFTLPCAVNFQTKGAST